MPTATSEQHNHKLPNLCSRWSAEDITYFRELLRKAAIRGATEAWPGQKHIPLEEFIRQISSIEIKYSVDGEGREAIRDAIIDAMHGGYKLKPPILPQTKSPD